MKAMVKKSKIEIQHSQYLLDCSRLADLWA